MAGSEKDRLKKAWGNFWVNKTFDILIVVMLNNYMFFVKTHRTLC